MNFVLNGELFHQLCGLMETGKLLSAKQKKKRALKEAAAIATTISGVTGDAGGGVASSSASGATVGAVRIVDDDDIYGDDLVVGKYVPAGSEEAVEDSGSAGVGTATADGSARGVFGSAGTVSASSSTSSSSAAQADLMKPIRDLLGAQQAKDQLKQQRILQHTIQQTTATAANSMVVEKDSSGKSLVHRDVFASTKDKVVQGSDGKSGGGKLGEVFGLRGGYDLFPETTGSYEVSSLCMCNC